jgi:DNA polymerase-3 subunit delta'
MSWNSVIDQHRLKHILQSSLERHRLAHAYLFSGPEGSGKYAAAIELAKTVNCERGAAEACDACPSCLQCRTLQHPDVNLIFALPVGKNEKQGDAPLAKLTDDEVALVQEQLAMKAKNPYHPIELARATTIKVNSIREIRKRSSMSAFSRGKKIFIIIDAELMNDEAANALLKTLEEPNEDTLLILTSSRADTLLPTLLSRCQHIRLDPLSPAALEAALREREGLEPDQARLIAHLARGSYTRALQYAHSSLGERRSEAVELLRAMVLKSRRELLEEIDRINTDYERPRVEELLQLLQYWLRDAMMLHAGIDSGIAGDDGGALRKFLQRYPSARYDALLDDLDRAISLLSKNVYIPLILLHLAGAVRSHVQPSPSH